MTDLDHRIEKIQALPVADLGKAPVTGEVLLNLGNSFAAHACEISRITPSGRMVLDEWTTLNPDFSIRGASYRDRNRYQRVTEEGKQKLIAIARHGEARLRLNKPEIISTLGEYEQADLFRQLDKTQRATLLARYARWGNGLEDDPARVAAILKITERATEKFREGKKAEARKKAEAVSLALTETQVAPE